MDSYFPNKNLLAFNGWMKSQLATHLWVTVLEANSGSIIYLLDYHLFLISQYKATGLYFTTPSHLQGVNTFARELNIWNVLKCQFGSSTASWRSNSFGTFDVTFLAYLITRSRFMTDVADGSWYYRTPFLRKQKVKTLLLQLKKVLDM